MAQNALPAMSVHEENRDTTVENCGSPGWTDGAVLFFSCRVLLEKPVQNNVGIARLLRK
jgi:hypothetical protein